MPGNRELHREKACEWKCERKDGMDAGEGRVIKERDCRECCENEQAEIPARLGGGAVDIRKERAYEEKEGGNKNGMQWIADGVENISESRCEQQPPCEMLLETGFHRTIYPTQINLCFSGLQRTCRKR